MRWYKKLAQILLILSVINFTHAAPVVAHEDEQRVGVVDAAIDGTTWPANAPDATNAPPIPRSSDSGHWHWREHNLRSRTDSNGSPEPSNPAPPINQYAPSLSPPRGPGSPSLSSSPDLLNPSSKMKSLSELMPMPTHDTPPRDGSSLILSSSDDSYASSSWVPTDSEADSHSGSTSSWSPQLHVSPPARLPGLSQEDLVPYPPSSKFKLLSELMHPHDAPPPDGSPQIASLADKSHTSSSWMPTDSHSGLPQHHVSPPAGLPGLSQEDLLPYPPSSKFKLLSELMPPHDAPPPDGSSQIASSADKSDSSSSWAPSDSHSGSTSLSLPEHHVFPPAGSPSPSPDLLNPSSKMKSLSELISTPTHDAPPPAGSLQIASSPDKSYSSNSWASTDSDSTSSPGSSTKPNPPPSAKRPRPVEPGTWGSSLMKMFEGKLKRRFPARRIPLQ